MRQLVMLLLISGAAFAAPPVKRAEHPGCMVWWFLPDCPLGKIFGADPLGIYPWEKFCKRYTAFDKTEFCKETVGTREQDTLGWGTF